MHVTEDEVSFIGVLIGSLMFCSCAETVKKPYLGGYCGGVPPLPIPNREVKPACADGTAMQCGRVGGRLFFRVESLTSVMMSGTLFLFGHMEYETYETIKLIRLMGRMGMISNGVRYFE